MRAIPLKEDKNTSTRSRSSNPKTLQLAVLGIDGSGKSTVARCLAEYLSRDRPTCLIGDHMSIYNAGEVMNFPIRPEEWIRHRINSLAKRSKSLKLYKVPKMLDLFLRDRCSRTYSRKLLSGAIVMDGSPLLNMVAWASLYKSDLLQADTCARAIGILTGKVHPESKSDPIYEILPELKTIQRLRLNKMVLPEECLFLDVSPANACVRIQARAERLQIHETKDKLSRLREAYLQACKAAEEQWHVKVHYINANSALEDVLQSSQQAIS